MIIGKSISAPVASIFPKASLEILFFLSTCGLSLILQCVYAGLKLHDSENIRWAAAAVSISPAAVAYLLLRPLGGKYFSALCVIGVTLIISLAHEKKISLTGMPISWNDLANTSNLLISISYFLLVDWLFLAALIFCLAALINHRFSKSERRTLVPSIFCVLLATPITAIAFYPYVVSARLEKALAELDISYMSWDWPGNIRRNGLLMHLVQTSLRPIPKDPTTSELAELALLPKAPRPIQNPQHVFYILCESCWNSTNHFSEIFKPLEDRGLIPFRAVSPGYGGGTVNSTFEMLTGLPVQGPLIGVVFQEYGGVFSANSRTVVSSMREQGYDTIALHNYFGDFWQRHIVMPKLGFREFISLEKMGYAGKEKFPPDSLLFDQTIRLLSEKRNDKVFFNLETVHMHGPYLENGDLGEKEYETRLKLTVQDIDEFIAKIAELSKNSLVVIYGDHKPSLNRFFFKNSVIEKGEFLRTGSTDEDFLFSPHVNMKKLGDVPVFIGYVGREKTDGTLLKQFVADVNGKSLYCLGAQISYFLLPSDDLSSRYMAKTVCNEYHTDNYHVNRARVPAWLYSETLF